MGRIVKRLLIVVAVVAMVGASACTPPPPPELPDAGCYAGPFGAGVKYAGPINTVNNATSHQAADCSGPSTGDQTVVFGPSEAEADAACVALGRTKGAFGEIDETGSGYWACVVYPPELAAGCYGGPFFTNVKYAGPINTVDNATTNDAADCTGTVTGGPKTVVYGQDLPEADAACVAIGKTGSALGQRFPAGPAADYWFCNL